MKYRVYYIRHEACMHEEIGLGLVRFEGPPRARLFFFLPFFSRAARAARARACSGGPGAWRLMAVLTRARAFEFFVSRARRGAPGEEKAPSTTEPPSPSAHTLNTVTSLYMFKTEIPMMRVYQIYHI